MSVNMVLRNLLCFFDLLDYRNTIEYIEVNLCMVSCD